MAMRTAACPKCRGAMTARAAVCPQCGYDFPPSPGRQFAPAWLVVLLFAGVAVAIAAAGGEPTFFGVAILVLVFAWVLRQLRVWPFTRGG